MNVYGPRIRKARAIAGLSQAELANKLGVEVATVKRKESPRGKEPKPMERIAIAAICGVSLDFLEGRVLEIEVAEDQDERRLREIEGQISELRESIAHLMGTTARHTRELRELHEADRRPQPEEDGS